ncbi:MAG TPA: cupin domain-containing protein, partial [Actinomycetota bacterium]|nr:cupin domain-containing protein [Actinomycetota bacterium]
MRSLDTTGLPPAPAWSEADLVDLTTRLANEPTPIPADRAWSVPLLVTGEVEAWLVGWPAGLVTPAHDHGRATVAVTVLEGSLSEECLDPTIWTTGRRTTWRAGASTLFPAGHVHVLGAAGDQPVKVATVGFIPPT